MASHLRSVEFALAVSVAALSCACVSIASAATVRVVDGTAIYVAAPGEANQVSVESDSLLGACSVGNLCLRDPALTQAGAGCVGRRRRGDLSRGRSRRLARSPSGSRIHP